MDLPTYTSIWRIEKRLYKLYDFRLPMPLPIGQLSVFAAIAVPYVVLLTLLSVPFNHTLIWLYVLPPGVATWLATRPVLEGKRLPELVQSQLRYLAEPKIWCRMAPLAERDVVVVTGRIWRSRVASRRAGEPEWSDEPSPRSADPQASQRPGRSASARRYEWGPPPVQVRPSRRPSPAAQAAPARWPGQGRAVPAAAASSAQVHVPGVAGAAPARVAEPAPMARSVPAPTLAGAAPPPGPTPAPAPPRPAGGQEPARRPTITVLHAGEQAPPPAVERALAAPSGLRGDIRTGRVSIVPGGQPPGKPGQLQRDRARARQPLGRPRRILVLGCTVGAGQTVTTLLTGDVLASLRSDDVAVLDLNPGVAGLSHRAKSRPALGQAASLAHSRLVVLEPGQRGVSGHRGQRSSGDDLDDRDYDYDYDYEYEYADDDDAIDPVAAARAFADASGRHQLVLADPSTVSVPRLLAVTDLLVLVAPASAVAVSAIGMTFEWLDAHGQAGLTAESIMVLNGVSRRSVAHVEQAERVCAGQCRAIVRVPWDETLKDRQAKRGVQPAPGGHSAGQHWSGLLSPATVAAYTALAGLIVAALGASEPDAATAKLRRVSR